MNPDYALEVSHRLFKENLLESNKQGVTIIAHMVQFDYGRDTFSTYGEFVPVNNRIANNIVKKLFNFTLRIYSHYVAKYGCHATKGSSVLHIEE